MLCDIGFRPSGLETMLSTLAATSSRECMLAAIRQRLLDRGTTLREAILQRRLYFRISLAGACNLACSFCHNEGAPARGRMQFAFAVQAIRAAKEVGFSRIQFTGGEPLLHPQIAAFVSAARQVTDDVGVTTNGTFLPSVLDCLIRARISRVHISLQTESLENAGSRGSWGIPDWLEPALRFANEGCYQLRLNLPVPASSLRMAEHFLDLLIPFGCDVQAFSILPEGTTARERYPVADLEAMVSRANQRRSGQTLARVSLRGFRPPTGIRCRRCAEFERCKEQSHSLRLGADGILRPCLATRMWDGMLCEDAMQADITEAAALALDYTW